MALLAGGSFLITRRLSDTEEFSRWQNLLEVLVVGLRDQIPDVSRQEPGRYLPFIGTLFVFIFTSNVLGVVPEFTPPTGSLSITAALAICVLIAVTIYAIAEQGVGGYLRKYVEPVVFMLPFNIIGEISRTVALAIRLYGPIVRAMDRREQRIADRLREAAEKGERAEEDRRKLEKEAPEEVDRRKREWLDQLRA